MKKSYDTYEYYLKNKRLLDFINAFFAIPMAIILTSPLTVGVGYLVYSIVKSVAH